MGKSQMPDRIDNTVLLSGQTSLKGISQAQHNVPSPPIPPVLSRDISKFGTQLLRGNIPANHFSETPILKLAQTDYKSDFDRIYNTINSSFMNRMNGTEAHIAANLILNDNLRSQATDRQKVALLKTIAHQLKFTAGQDPVAYQKLTKAIDRVIQDFKEQGKMERFLEIIFMEMEDPSNLLSTMTDWGARRLAQNETILSAATPAQKASLLYALWLFDTYKGDQQAINTILKNAIDHHQFKAILGYWSDSIDPRSSNIDALYNDMSGHERTRFLKLIRQGIKQEAISEPIMKNLYGGSEILKALESLAQAENLENAGELAEAAEIYAQLTDTKKSEALLSQNMAQNYQRGNILGTSQNILGIAKIGSKNVFNSIRNHVEDFFEDGRYALALSYARDQLDKKLQEYPSLQPKNTFEMREKRAQNLQRLSQSTFNHLTTEEKAQHHQQFETRIDELTETQSHDGNRMKLLLNGDEAYERIKKRIENAKESIYVEVFLFHDDEKGFEMADALIKKANEGLDVRVVVDGPANMAHKPVLKRLENSKVKFEKYEGSFDDPIRNRGMVGYHRKLYIFDQKYAMTGGINLGSQYLTEGQWHDLLVEVQGPIMSDLLNNFYDQWAFSAKTPLEKAPPPEDFQNLEDENHLPVDGEGNIRLLTTDPRKEEKDIKIWMLEAIQHAHTRILIQDPYFNDPEIIRALTIAVNRGVKVDVIFPNSNDVPIFKHMDDNTLDELYIAGAHVYSYNTNGKESFNHLKATVIDDMVSLGSSNKDVRAMNTNQEINLVIDNKDFTGQVVARIFQEDIRNSQPAVPETENFVKRLSKEFLKRNPSFF